MSPSPTVDTATTVAGGNWSGQVVLGDGATTAFNMTLIARGLGATSGARTQAQASRNGGCVPATSRPTAD